MVFGKRSSCGCSQTTISSTSWWHLRPGDRSRDFTTYIFLHRNRTSTSTEVLPCLVWLIQRISVHLLPSATAPTLGTLLFVPKIGRSHPTGQTYGRHQWDRCGPSPRNPIWTSPLDTYCRVDQNPYMERPNRSPDEGDMTSPRSTR
jgi:hypothetical protein